MTDPIATYKGYVAPWECDEMGHMNIQFYFSKVQDADLHLMDGLGLNKERRWQSGTVLQPTQYHVRFHKELFASDLVVIQTSILSVNDCMMEVYHEVRNGLTGALAATMVVTLLHRAADTPSPIALAGDIRLNAQNLIVPLAPEGVPRSFPLRSPFDTPDMDVVLDAKMPETNRSAVSPDECSSNGRLSTRGFMSRVSDSQGHMWALAGLDRQSQKQQGLATATVEMRLNFFLRPEVDTTMVMHTQLVEAAAKTLHYRHWLFDAASGTPIASHNGVGLLFSKADRKAVAIPPAVAERFAKSS